MTGGPSNDRVPRGLAYCLMILAVTQGIVGLVVPRFPGWQMFKRVERFTYTLKDNRNRPVRVEDYLPERAYYLVSHRSVLAVGQWIAEREPDRTPLEGTLVLYEHGKPVRYRLRFPADEEVVPAGRTGR